MNADRHPQSQYNAKDQRKGAPYMAGQSDKVGVTGAQQSDFNAGHQTAQAAAGRPTGSSATGPVRVGDTGAMNDHQKEHPDAKDKLMAAKDRTLGTMKEQWGKITSNTKTEEEGRALRERGNLSPTHHTGAAGHHEQQPAGGVTGGAAGAHRTSGVGGGHHDPSHEKPSGYTAGAMHGGNAGTKTSTTGAGTTGSGMNTGLNTGMGGHPSTATTGAGFTGANTGAPELGTGVNAGLRSSTGGTGTNTTGMPGTGGMNTGVNTGLRSSAGGTGTTHTGGMDTGAGAGARKPAPGQQQHIGSTGTGHHTGGTGTHPRPL